MSEVTDDPEMLERASKLLAHVRNPNTWGEGRYEEEEVLPIWEWAERTGRFDLQAEIAAAAGAEWSSRYRGSRDREWDFKILSLMERASKEGRLKEYVGLLEAHIPKILYNSKQGIELYELAARIYVQLGEPEREIYALYGAANLYAHIKKWHQAKRLYLAMYNKGIAVNFRKGIALALDGLGNLLYKKRKYVEACQFLFQADVIFQQIRSHFGIPTHELLRDIRREKKIDPSRYEIETTPDELIRWFVKTFGAE